MGRPHHPRGRRPPAPPTATRSTASILAARVRAIVADAAETVLRTADHALGPAPLVADDAHARRVADLHLYLRQHHAERDLARLGRDLIARDADSQDGGRAW